MADGFLAAKLSENCKPHSILSNGSFTLTETDSGTDSDLESKPIVLCTTCSHCTDSDLDLYSLLLYSTGIGVLSPCASPSLAK